MKIFIDPRSNVGHSSYYIQGLYEEEIANAVALLASNHSMRHTLEQNAKQYYETYASPIQVIKRIFNYENPARQ